MYVCVCVCVCMYVCIVIITSCRTKSGFPYSQSQVQGSPTLIKICLIYAIHGEQISLSSLLYIRVITHISNSGYIQEWNFGLQQATGKLRTYKLIKSTFRYEHYLELSPHL